MNFCTFGNDYIKGGYTQIDNIFLAGYLPSADPTDVKVYLYGLYLAGNVIDTNNTIEKMSLVLKLSEERILDAFGYWEEQGLVSVSKTHPVSITYNSVKSPMTATIKYNARLYSSFVEEMARLFPDNILTPNELTAYIDILRNYKMEINAMLMIARYCMDTKKTVNTPYILAVATNWAQQGIVTESAVSDRIETLENNSEDMRSIFKALGLTSQPSIEDRQLYLKWTIDYGYSMDAVLTACRMCKHKGGMHKLENIMEELKNANAFTSEEIAKYSKDKDAVRQLAIDVVGGIGSYYANIEVVVDTYITPWLAKGFEEDALRKTAKFCFLRNIKTLDGVNEVINKFYQSGILTEAGITAYIDSQQKIDDKIKEILQATQSTSHVTNRDREFYRVFVQNWGFSHEVILFVASKTAGKTFPMSEINRMLAHLKEQNAFSIEEAQKLLDDKPSTAKNTKNASKNYIQQNYTAEQLASAYTDVNDIDLNEI